MSRAPAAPRCFGSARMRACSALGGCAGLDLACREAAGGAGAALAAGALLWPLKRLPLAAQTPPPPIVATGPRIACPVGAAAGAGRRLGGLLKALARRESARLSRNTVGEGAPPPPSGCTTNAAASCTAKAGLRCTRADGNMGLVSTRRASHIAVPETPPGDACPQRISPGRSPMPIIRLAGCASQLPGPGCEAANCTPSAPSAT